jgi:hypothetical protein
MMKAIRSSETSVLTRATRRNRPEGGILHSHRREKPQSELFLLIIVEVYCSKGKVCPVFNELNTTLLQRIGKCMYRSTFSWPGTSRWVVSFMPRLLYPREMTLGTHWIGWMGLITGLSVMDVRSFALTGTEF